MCSRWAAATDVSPARSRPRRRACSPSTPTQKQSHARPTLGQPIDAAVAAGSLLDEARYDHDVLMHYPSGAALLAHFAGTARNVPNHAIPTLRTLGRPCVTASDAGSDAYACRDSRRASAVAHAPAVPR